MEGVRSPVRSLRLVGLDEQTAQSLLSDKELRGTPDAWQRLVAGYTGNPLALKIVAQTINELKSAESPKIIEHFEKGAKYDLLKTRQGYFRGSDHQLMHEMYAVTALPADKIKNQWDIFTSSPAVPGPNEDLEVIAATKEENSCTFPS